MHIVSGTVARMIPTVLDDSNPSRSLMMPEIFSPLPIGMDTWHVFMLNAPQLHLLEALNMTNNESA
jgi:hypothetical protein